MKPPLGIAPALLLALCLSPVGGFAQERQQGSERMGGAQPSGFVPFSHEDTSSDHADIQWALLDAEVLQLDKLVSLTTDQQVKAYRIFTTQNHGYLAVGTLDDQLGMAGAQLRAILTPAQLQVFDRKFPDGGDVEREARAISNRIAKWVGLTGDQLERVNGIYLKEGIELYALIPPTDPKVAEAIRQGADDKVRALLTPEQQKRFDGNPTAIASIEEKRFVDNLLRTSDKIAARYGTIKGLALRRSRSSDFDSNGHPLKGDFMYNVEGSLKSEYIYISWDRSSEAAPIEITKVEAATGGNVAI